MNDAIWIGLGIALAVAFAAAARAAGAQRERRLFAYGLVIAALIYVGFAAIGGAGIGWLWLEVGGLAVYGAFAWLGLRRSVYFLAAGWLLHVVWDVALHGSTAIGGSAFVPAWYPPACLGFDIAIAIVATGRARQAAQAAISAQVS